MSESWNPPPAPGIHSPAPNNHMVLGILATVVSVSFCCGIPHGLISLIFALQVNKRAAAGDLQGAESAARQAKIWAIISIVVAVLGLVIAFVTGILAAVVG